MVSYLAFAEFFHVLFAAMWVGTSIYGEVVSLRLWRQARSVGEMRFWLGILRRTGPFQTITAILVLLTGLIYMFLLYGTDFSAIAGFPSGQLVLASLGIVLIAIGLGLAVIMPTSRRLGKTPMPADPAAPIPPEAQALAVTIRRLITVNTILIVVVLFLMVVAAYGGF